MAVSRRRLLLRLAAVAAAVSVAAASSSSSTSASVDVDYCSETSVEKVTANPLVTKCSAASGYNFSSGVQPTVEQAQDMCGTCLSLFQTASLSTDDCVLPMGDHIYLLADLVNYVLAICYADSGSSSGSAASTSSSSTATDSSASSGGGGATSIAIGVVAAAVVLLALLGGLFWWRRRRRRKDSSETDQFNSQGGYVPMLSNVDQIRRSNFSNSTGQHVRTGTTATTTSSSSAFSSSSRRKRARLADLSPWRVDIDSIQDLERLGHGAHGVVWRVLYRGSTVLASKRIQADQVSTQLTQRFIDEIFLLSHLQHPNIVAFVGVAWTMELDVQVLLEFMDAGDLRGFLTRPETPREWTLQKLSIAHDVAQALVYVHSFQPPLLHRDLKSQNVLLTARQAVEDQDVAMASSSPVVGGLEAAVMDTPLIAKLTDFGVSRFHSENNTMTVGVGTSRWLAPEVIVGETNYGPEADMFSFGVVLSELDSHALPYDDARGEGGESLATVAILQRVALGQLKPTFNVETCPSALLALALRCLDHDGAKRPSAPMVAYELRKIMKTMVDRGAESESARER